MSSRIALAARSSRALAALVLGASPLLAAGGGGDPAATATSGGARWGAEYFPNVPLVTHEGKTVRFFDDLIRDKVVVINFIYTSCPDACPLETAKLTEVHSILGDRVGKDVFMCSISIDPETDTPEVLHDYAERFQVGPGWQFLTGDAADIRLLRQKLGMIRSGEEELSDHTLSLLIGNQATGMWMKRSPMENPYLLATQIGSWLHGWKLPPKPGLDYKDAPKLRNIARGEDLYRTRCATCHGIGADDGILRQGPNLVGVTDRRERAWLSRWLAEPDVMLAERDPIAVELFEANRNLPMPNLRLNAVEIEAVLGYIETESDRFLEEQRLAAADWAESDSGHGGEFEDKPACCQKDEDLVLGSESGSGAGSHAIVGDVLGGDTECAVPNGGTRPSGRRTAAKPGPAPERGFSARVSVSLALAAALCLLLARASGILSLASRRG